MGSKASLCMRRHVLGGQEASVSAAALLFQKPWQCMAVAAIAVWQASAETLSSAAIRLDECTAALHELRMLGGSFI